MPIAPTYPGVYIEEIPSGVHTITGVATSITAFIGYTQQGPVDQAVHIFSFADFQRAFGGVTVDSPLSHAVKDFFQNGGTEGYVVRAAQGAQQAEVTLRDSADPSTGDAVLRITALAAGMSGNYLRVLVDYDTANPASLFNLSVIELIPRDGDLVVGRTEKLGNLSMDSKHPSYAESVINSRSQLVRATRTISDLSGHHGTSTGGVLTPDVTKHLGPGYRVGYSLDGQAPREAVVSAPTAPASASLEDALKAITTDLTTAIPGIEVDASVTSKDRLAFRSKADGEQSSLHFLGASRDSATATLKLGTANGGVEADAAAVFRPARSGTVRKPTSSMTLTGGAVTGTDFGDTPDQLAYVVNGTAGVLNPTTKLTDLNAVNTWLQKKIPNVAVAVAASGTQLVFTATIDDPTKIASINFEQGPDATKSLARKLNLLPPDAVSSRTFKITINRGESDIVQKDIDVPAAPGASPPTTLYELAAQWQRNLDAAAQDSTKTLLRGSTVRLIGGEIQVVPGGTDPNIWFEFVDGGQTTVADPKERNVAAYAPGTGMTARAQVGGTVGSNGTPPGTTELSGDRSAKTGLYALEDVDLFNILVMPDATAGSGFLGALGDAIAYCQERRAFMIIDVPETVVSFDEAQKWISGGDAASLRSRNAALYYPRVRMPDPFNPSVVTTYATAGALAGLYARTDADRGVWKAPAGTAATIEGAVGLNVKLTDRQNGALNPLGLNCLRMFPVYGAVSWGARTSMGADAQADDYKYIPVRRLALYLEESLYRGTQWVVFEPNDEPLWAQIRLNLGAFMHTLFAQGAFKGQTPREAYFVKCDKDTTTQNDIDLGRVNIVVGFAPLKPAEFVIIQIQQIAGPIQT